MGRGIDDLENRVPVLFIAGGGRTGSTFLDTVLGNHPDVASYGELYRLPRDGWLEGGSCACGELAGSCPFWSEVRRIWQGPSGNDGLEAYVALDDRFRRMGSWGRLLVELSRPSPALRDYMAQTLALFRAIRDVGGKTWLVDSSKFPARAMILSRTPGIDFYVIHLVRDGRGVLWSLKKLYDPALVPALPSGDAALSEVGAEGPPLDRRPPGPDPRSLRLAGDGRPAAVVSTWEAAQRWTRKNLAAEWLRRRMPRDRSIRVRYEDLVSDPRSVLGEIGRLVNLEMGALADALIHGEELEVGHTIYGNRLRMEGRIRLRPDTAWRDRLDPGDRRLFWLLTSWLMKSYGYRR